MKKKDFVVLESARCDEQRVVMEKIQKRGECPFCLENLPKYHAPPILAENEHWVATKNQWPYENTEHHFLLICREHILYPEETPSAFVASLWELVRELGKKYGFDSGGFAIRFGAPERTGGSVRHLHAHVIVGFPGDNEKYGQVFFRVA